MTQQRSLIKLINILKSPKFVTLAIIVLFAAIAYAKSRDYGLTWDEPVQNLYGFDSLSWYMTHGKDLSFLRIGHNLQYHGPFYEWVIAYVQMLTHHTWYVRSLMTISAGIIGFVAIALCGFAMKRPWVAVLAVILFILFPRYSGDIFTNSKDIPFAASYCFVLWSVFHLLNTWNKKYGFLISSVIVGVLLGMSTAIRIVTVMWWPILVLISLGAWVINYRKYKNTRTIRKEMIKQAVAGVMILAISFGVMTVLWPYVFLNPIQHFIEAVRDMSHFPFTTPIYFQGKLDNPIYTPRDFSLVWLSIATPIATMFFFFTGLVFYGRSAVKKKSIDPYISICLLAGIVPLITIIVLDSTLYNGVRQFLFIVPPLLLVASFGFVELVKTVNRKRAILVMLIGVTMLYYVNVVFVMGQLHPYEYIYFNELVGGLKGASGNYEIDYWGASYKACADWLGVNYQHYVQSKVIHVYPNTTDKIHVMNALPSNFIVDLQNPNFYITLASNEPYMSEKVYPNSPVIYQESRFNTPLCEVKLVNPKALPPLLSNNKPGGSSSAPSWHLEGF